MEYCEHLNVISAAKCKMIIRKKNYKVERKGYPKTHFAWMLCVSQRFIGPITDGFDQNCSKELKYYSLFSVNKRVGVNAKVYPDQCFPCFWSIFQEPLGLLKFKFLSFLKYYLLDACIHVNKVILFVDFTKGILGVSFSFIETPDVVWRVFQIM